MWTQRGYGSQPRPITVSADDAFVWPYWPLPAPGTRSCPGLALRTETRNRRSQLFVAFPHSFANGLNACHAPGLDSERQLLCHIRLLLALVEKPAESVKSAHRVTAFFEPDLNQFA